MGWDYVHPILVACWMKASVKGLPPYVEWTGRMAALATVAHLGGGDEPRATTYDADGIMV